MLEITASKHDWLAITAANVHAVVSNNFRLIMDTYADTFPLFSFLALISSVSAADILNYTVGIISNIFLRRDYFQESLPFSELGAKPIRRDEK